MLEPGAVRQNKPFFYICLTTAENHVIL